MHLYCSSGVNCFKVNETFVDYTLSFNFHDTNLGDMLFKKFVLKI